ncbi:MAG: XrtA/PEP-CTERM system histidine kinase PrsK [bacterium]
MNIFWLPTLISFPAFIILGTYVYARNRGQWINRLFCFGMGAFALMEFGNLMSLFYIGSLGAIFWKRIAITGECLVPGAWLMFSMSFAGKKPWYELKGWKWIIICLLGLSLFFAASIPSGLFLISTEYPSIMRLGGIGKAFYIFFLLSAVMVLALLEHTIRQAKGDQRPKIRALVLGLGGLCAYLVFLTSQALLFSKLNLKMIPVSSSFFIICLGVIAFSVARHQLMDVNLYMSRFVVYNSLTLFIVGGYLIFIGLVGQAIRSFKIIPGFPAEIIFLFVTILLLFGLILTDRVRWRIRSFINRHFYRSRYDYRDEWLRFAEGLSLKLNINDLITTTVDMLRDAVGIGGISIWLYEENVHYFKPMSPSFLIDEACMRIDQKLLQNLIVKNEPYVIDIPHFRASILENSQILDKLQPVMLVPLVSGKKMVGLIFLGRKKTGEKYLGDDIDLLKSSAAQIAGAIMNAKLSQELIKAKEMEVFHRFSSFLVHDLKNLVSSLSMVLQNADEHMSNPQFQKDTLDIIKRSVKKMDSLIARLSGNTVAEKFNFQEIALNDVVLEVVRRMGHNGLKSKTIKTDLRQVPKILCDREQIEKVIMNLLINALEAIDNNGFVKIRSEAQDKKIILSVSDNGSGMSTQFMEKSLFTPFKSTKKKGLGIGLFQCKSIVEAHQGKIEVESKEGVGSTFRILMPLTQVRKNNENGHRFPH